MFLSFAIECSALDQFLDHWSGVYEREDAQNRDRTLYEPYVGKPLTAESRRLLFEWKNGSKLSAKKMASVEKHYPLPGESEGLDKYLSKRRLGGPIWNIFYMHCVTPKVWPIFDRHTFRAIQFIRTGRIEEIPKRSSQIFTFYQNEYIPFMKNFGDYERKIDRALYSFGRFLKVTSRLAEVI